MVSKDALYDAKIAAQNAAVAAQNAARYQAQALPANPLSAETMAANAQDAARYQAQANASIIAEPSSQMAAGNAYAAAADSLAAEAAALQEAAKAEQESAIAKTESELQKALAAKAKAEKDAADARAALAAAQSKTTTTTTTTATPALDSAKQDIIATLTDRFTRYKLEGLIPTIKKLATEGATEATITLELQNTDAYKERFKANDVRIKKGLSVLSPAEYLNVEDGYRQVLRTYGLKQFDTDAYVQQFIGNDVSPTEFSNRVVTAVQRVQNADPAISKQLRDYYGIGQTDLVAYALDPEQNFQKIERQVAAAEIGVAAARQGLTAGVSVAEQLAAQGVTQAEAQKGYATIADILPTAQKLSDIYGTTMDTYGQSEAEQEVFNSLASAQRKRQALTARELAQFSGASGAGKSSFASQTRGQI